MLSTETAPLTIGATTGEEAAFAQAIADRLADDLVARCGRMTRLFKRSLELYVLDTGCHISNDRLRAAECNQSHVTLSPRDAQQRETIRSIVASILPSIIERHKLPFVNCQVEVVELSVYAFDGTNDRYGTNFALHITLSR